MPARLTGYGERWDGDECVLYAEGVVRQAAVYGEAIELRRRVEARVGESRFTIHDEVVVGDGKFDIGPGEGRHGRRKARGRTTRPSRQHRTQRQAAPEQRGAAQHLAAVKVSHLTPMR